MEGIGNWLKTRLTFQERQEKIPRWDFFLLFLFAAVFILMQNSWISYLPPDQGNMEEVQNSVRHFLYLQGQAFRLPSTITDYPPLIYLISCFFYFLFGFSIKMTYFSSTFLSLFMIYALYGIGFFYGGRVTGWLMVFLSLGNPRTLYWGRFYTQNYPEMAFFAVSFWLLLLCRGFTQKIYSALLGLMMGLSLLTRYAFFYLASAVFWAGAVLFKRELKTVKKIVPALLLIAGLTVGGKFLVNFLYYSNIYSLFRDNYLLTQIIGMLLGAALLIIGLKYPRKATPLWSFAVSVLSALLIALPWFIAALDLQFNKGSMYSITVGPKAIIFKIFWLYLSLVFPGITIFALLGLGYLLYNWKSYPMQLLAWGLCGTLFLLSCLIIDPLYRYSLPLQIYMVLLSICWVRALPKPGQSVLLVSAMLWFCLNLAGVGMLEGKQVLPGTLAYRAVSLALNLSQYNNPIFTASGNVKKESPNRIALEEKFVKQLALAIKQNTPNCPPRGLKILFLNYLPNFSTYTWQMETYLLALGFFPEKKFSQDQAAVEYHFINKQRPDRSDFSQWNYLLLVSPRETDFASGEQFLRQRKAKLQFVRQFEITQKYLGSRIDFKMRLYYLGEGYRPNEELEP